MNWNNAFVHQGNSHFLESPGKGGVQAWQMNWNNAFVHQGNSHFLESPGKGGVQA